MLKNHLEKYPVDIDGNLLHWTNGKIITWEIDDDGKDVRRTYPVTLVDNTVQDLTVKLIDWQRGHSSIIYVWQDVSGKKWPMFASEMFHLVSTRSVMNGTLTARFKVMKRGQNYSLTLVEDE
jgi:hypothetical protein